MRKRTSSKSVSKPRPSLLRALPPIRTNWDEGGTRFPIFCNFDVIGWKQAKFFGEMIGQKFLRLVFSSKPDCGAVITLEREPRRRVEFFCNRSYTRGKFGMFEKEGNERKPPARFCALCKGGNQARGIFMQGVVLTLPAHNKVDVQGAQGIGDLIACDRGCSAHNRIISHADLSHAKAHWLSWDTCPEKIHSGGQNKKG